MILLWCLQWNTAGEDSAKICERWISIQGTWNLQVTLVFSHQWTFLQDWNYFCKQRVFLYYKVPVTCNALRFLRENLVCVVNAISHQESLSAISMIHLSLQVYHFYSCWALVESKSIMEARRCWANCLQPRWRLRANVARQGVDTREHNLLLPPCPCQAVRPALCHIAKGNEFQEQ